MSQTSATEEQTKRWIATYDEVKARYGNNFASGFSDLACKHFHANGSKDWGPSYEYGIKLMQEKLKPPPLDDTEYLEILAAQELMEGLQ